MANPTTNYGFVMPSPTDLVTDLPADFDVFGQAVDTQMLTNANAAIAKTIVDAKGDLIGATAADTPARLAVGTNGQVLTADSTAATGLKWAAVGGGGKVLQVVQATYSTSTNIATTTFTDTGLSASITPTLSTSKILILLTQSIGLSRGAADADAPMQLVRGATAIYTTADSYGIYVGSGANSAQLYTLGSLSYLDSPATTSTTTYKTQLRVKNTAISGQVYAQSGNETSTLILLEIGA
jgi:hypothetical protein